MVYKYSGLSSGSSSPSQLGPGSRRRHHRRKGKQEERPPEPALSTALGELQFWLLFLLAFSLFFGITTVLMVLVARRLGFSLVLQVQPLQT